MDVVRVTVAARVTSFRHPFFVTGHQPTFDVPPPSTIHGHCASALGRWPDPESFFFGVHFRFRARGSDLEHQHITKPRSIEVQPVLRDFLFDAELTLYLDPELGHAFRRPVYPMVLGRSQDLAEVTAVDAVTLERPARARLEHTLLPIRLRPAVRFGTTVLLSRYVAPPPERDVTFAQYISLHDPMFYGEGADPNQAVLRVPGVSFDDLWCDPTVADEDGFARGVWIHRLVGPS